MRGKHEWGHMGIDMDTNESYSYCDICKKYQCCTTIVPKSQYIKRLKAGKITLDGKVLPPDWVT